jgi:hypothetical protein
MNEDQRLKAFLEGLTKLTQEHGIKIMGCGCCGSPFLDYLGDDSIHSLAEDILGDADNLEYNEKEEEYIIHNSNGSVRFL